MTCHRACHLYKTLLTITVADVYEALISLNVEKSPGTDKISLRYATLPNCWKVHKIVPVFKAGHHNSANNYRPISLLSNTSKFLEQIIYRQ